MFDKINLLVTYIWDVWEHVRMDRYSITSMSVTINVLGLVLQLRTAYGKINKNLKIYITIK